MNNVISAKELAEILNGREYCFEITRKEQELAKKSGLVVLFGYSDDNMEFRGALRDEISCFDGGTVYVSSDGISKNLNGGKEIEAIWCERDDVCWTYKTDIPHETFSIYDEGELFCEGIVFSIADVKDFEYIGLHNTDDGFKFDYKPITAEQLAYINDSKPN